MGVNVRPVLMGEIKKEAIAKNIERGVELKPTETVDKAAPKIEDVKLKTVDHKPHLAAIEGEHQLKPAETVDKAAPKIEGMRMFGLFLYHSFWFNHLFSIFIPTFFFTRLLQSSPFELQQRRPLWE